METWENFNEKVSVMSVTRPYAVFRIGVDVFDRKTLELSVQAFGGRLCLYIYSHAPRGHRALFDCVREIAWKIPGFSFDTEIADRRRRDNTRVWGHMGRFFPNKDMMLGGIDEDDRRSLFSAWSKIVQMLLRDGIVVELTAKKKKRRQAVCKRQEIGSGQVNSAGNFESEKYDFKWKGWKQYYEMWDKFDSEWFAAKGHPNDSLTKCLREALNCKNADVKLNSQELPEPYYGRGEAANGVIVHLNPGASTENERVKVLGSGGFLINSFENDCKANFRAFATRWSPLWDVRKDSAYPKNPKEIPGYDWWHKRNRVGWLTRFYGDNGVSGMEHVFALEACPYHSKRWTGGMRRVEQHIVENVIVPAIVCASGFKKRKCAVFVGKEFNELVVRLRGIKKIGYWPKKREYTLYYYEDDERSVYLLVIKGVSGMYLPKDDAVNRATELEICRKIDAGDKE